MNLLYCEDDSFIRELTISSLKEKFELNIISCENGLKGFQILQSFSVDFIISDNEMRTPGGSGVDLFYKTKEIGLEIPFILYSGMPEGSFSHLSQYSNFKFIHKFNRKELIDVISSIITSKGI